MKDEEEMTITEMERVMTKKSRRMNPEMGINECRPLDKYVRERGSTINDMNNSDNLFAQIESTIRCQEEFRKSIQEKFLSIKISA